MRRAAMVGFGIGCAALFALGVALLVAPPGVERNAGTERDVAVVSSGAPEVAAPTEVASPTEIATPPDTPATERAQQPETTPVAPVENTELDVLRRAIEQARRARVEQAAASASAEAPGTDDTERARGRLGREYITDAVREIRPLLAECYELARDAAERAGEDAPEGRLVMRFVVGGEPGVGGVIEESEVLDTSTLRDPVLDECFAETLRTLELPPPEEGGQVEVHYPFELSAREP